MPQSNSNCSCVVCCVFDTCYRIILSVRVFFNLLLLNNFRFTGSHQSFVAGVFFFIVTCFFKPLCCVGGDFATSSGTTELQQDKTHQIF